MPDYRYYDNYATPPQSSPIVEHREAYSTWEYAVKIPLMLSAVTGLFAGILTGTLLLYLGAGIAAVKWSFLVSIFTSVGMWLLQLLRWWNATGVEVTHYEFNSDRQAAPPPDPFHLILTEANGEAGNFYEFPATKAQMLEFARLTSLGHAPSHGAFVPSVFSRGEFEQFRNYLIERGFANWRNADAPAQGWGLTHKGRAVVRGIHERRNEI